MSESYKPLQELTGPLKFGAVWEQLDHAALDRWDSQEDTPVIVVGEAQGARVMAHVKRIYSRDTSDDTSRGVIVIELEDS